MRASFLALALAVMMVIGATAVFTTAELPDETLRAASAEPASTYDAQVVSFDGAIIPITIYKPAGASAAAPVPVILHSHGWGGSRITDGSGIVGRLWNEGFAVITIDARGHGDSVALAEVHHKDFEVKDTIVLLDHIYDELDWVAKEPASGIPKDIIAGGAGYSYGGGMQLTAASYDKRLDAIAPEITWTDLGYSLAPENAPKSVWIDILIGFAKQGDVKYDPRIDDWFAQILLTGEVPQEALDHFAGSNPILDEIDADVLFIQGVPDVLFNMNNAIAGYKALNARGTGDIRLFTHLTGHVLPGIQPFGTTNRRAVTFEEEGPCGVNADIISSWLHEKLMDGPASGIPEVSFALDNGECVAYDALPTGSSEFTLAALPVPSAAGTVLVPLLQGPALLAGIPHLKATGTDAVVVNALAYAGLVILSPNGHQRIVDDQTQPIRLHPGQTLDVDLAGVAARMGTGDKLFLRIDGLNEWNAHNGQRIPGATLLTDITVTLPLIG